VFEGVIPVKRANENSSAMSANWDVRTNPT
jgi:hypothetical protein